MDSFRDRTVLVTGAASGIGRATSIELARRGASLVLVDIDASGLSSVDAEARALGASARTFVVDVADAAAIESLARDVGAIDVLVNNAGIAVGAPFLHTSARDWERLFGVNVLYPQLWVTLVGLVAVVLLYGLFRYSRTGIAMRAVVDDPDLVAMQATSPTRVR